MHRADFRLRRRTLRRLAAGAVAAAALRPASAAAAAATVAAASDLHQVLPELAALFERGGGDRLRLVFGASGHLHAQLMQRAPFDLFLSADESYVFRLADAGLTVDRGRVYAHGRIGIVVPNGSPLVADGSLRDLAAALADGRVVKFAIANPEHAPYGQRAAEALRHAGLWQSIARHLVVGENVSQAAQFAVAGSAQGGIVASSLALAPAFAARSRFDLIDASWHRPLVQRMVLLRGAAPAAVAFRDFVASPAAQAVLSRHGFGMPRD